MTQHTQGEWEVCADLEILSEHGRFIAHVGYQKGETNAEDEANARLIAAAPKLLELLVSIEMLVHVNANLVDGSPIYKAITAAIAAAKGE